MAIIPSQTAPDWSTIFDELRQKESLASDAKLADSLGVSRGYICSVRKGRKGVSLPFARLIFSKLGRTFAAEQIEKLFIPSRVRSHTSNLVFIRGQVIARARGHCQLCGAAAPFNSPDGQPYLLVQNVIPFSEGGDDSIRNLVALCPNCNEKLIVAPEPTDIQSLKATIKKYSEADR